MKTLLRMFAALASMCGLALAVLVLYVRCMLPDSYTLMEGERLQLDRAPFYAQTIEDSGGEDSYQVDLKMPGGFTVKRVQVQVEQRRKLVPSGAPFGVKMFTRGVIVVGLSDVPSGGQRCNPARRAGLQTGDVILEIDGQAVNGNRMVGDCIARCGGSPMELLVQREESCFTASLQPVRSDNDGSWRAGVWIRDSSAGIGTMTYCDPENGAFSGLGHPICDVDTGELMPLNNGEVVGVDITGIRKGRAGDAGELQGSFLNGVEIGQLLENTETGVYGALYAGVEEDLAAQAVPVAACTEIRPGPATILTTISGTRPREYDICIEKVDRTNDMETKNMVIRVTDPELLNATGGIVQGMSGSPIIQDGKLVGAVTHVFVNDPTRGYGIFIENMLDAAG